MVLARPWLRLGLTARPPPDFEARRLRAHSQPNGSLRIVPARLHRDINVLFLPIPARLMRTSSLALAAVFLAALAFALPNVSATTVCTPMTVAEACADITLPPNPLDVAPSHVCVWAGINPQDGHGGVESCPVYIFHSGHCYDIYLVIPFTLCVGG